MKYLLEIPLYPKKMHTYLSILYLYELLYPKVFSQNDGKNVTSLWKVLSITHLQCESNPNASTTYIDDGENW